MNKVTMILMAMLWLNTANAQFQDMKCGKIPSADLAMERYEFGLDAAAVVLADHGEIKFAIKNGDLVYFFERHVRIKIFNSEGYDYGDESFAKPQESGVFKAPLRE